MLAFLKRWRQAYLEDKGNRLHAEVDAERCKQLERDRVWRAMSSKEKEEHKKEVAKTKRTIDSVLSCFRPTNDEYESRVFKGFD